MVVLWCFTILEGNSLNERTLNMGKHSLQLHLIRLILIIRPRHTAAPGRMSVSPTSDPQRRRKGGTCTLTYTHIQRLNSPLSPIPYVPLQGPIWSLNLDHLQRDPPSKSPTSARRGKPPDDWRGTASEGRKGVPKKWSSPAKGRF